MKKSICWIILVLFGFQSYAQVSDDFSDGDFTNTPTWLGDTSNFIINNQFQLQLSAATAGKSSLSTLSNFGSSLTQWQFSIQLRFAPSNNNYARFYLISSHADLNDENLFGYYLCFGESGSNDAIKLYKQNNGNHQLLVSGTIGTIAAAFNLSIKVILDSTGLFCISYSDDSSMIYQDDACIIDTGNHVANYVGLQCVYTASNATRFYFDNIYHGNCIFDTIAPILDSLHTLDRKTIELKFSEIIDSSKIKANHFHIQPDNLIPSALSFQNDLVTLYFSNELPENTPLTLSIDSIVDLSGNRLFDTAVTLLYYRSRQFDLLINEIMAKPTPAIGLPPAEYIELYNPRNYSINTNGWKLVLGSNTRLLGNFDIAAHSYVLLTAVGNKSLFEPFGQIIGLSSLQITDAGQAIFLYDNNEQLIHHITYSKDFYRDAGKQDGGWSVEMIDPNNPCKEFENWQESLNPQGGSPCQENTVKANNPDIDYPTINTVFANNDTTITLFFSEEIITTQLLNTSVYKISHNIAVKEIADVATDRKSISLTLKSKLLNDNIYTLSVVDTIGDCVGNLIPFNHSIDFVLPENALSNDLVINEILFNPNNDGVDFVELYNRSNKHIDLQKIKISNLKQDGSIDTGKTISEKGSVLLSGQYLVVSTNSKILEQQYYCPFPENLLQMESLPTYANESGTVILLSNQEVIDRFDYNKDMHYGLLKDVKGVSLERINPFRTSNDKNNWHSAASTVGYATPGYKNSCFLDTSEQKDVFDVYPSIFSPDLDGYNDILNICYRFNLPGNRATIELYNMQGKKIKTLMNNEFLDTEGCFTWDGMLEENMKAGIGNYIILITYWNTDNKAVRIKKECTLATKF